MLKIIVLIGRFELFTGYSQAVFGEQLVNKISLSGWKILIECSQFIERTEMSGGSQQIDAERLKDNPR